MTKGDGSELLDRRVWHYRHSGVVIASEIALDEWSIFACDGIAGPDIEVRLVETHDTPAPEDGEFVRDSDAAHFAIQGVGHWKVEGGQRIAVAAANEADPAAISLFTRGSAWAALAMQRGWSLWHGSAVKFAEIEGAIAFCGASGAGKSTLAAQCVAAGAALLSDDLSRVERSSAGVKIYRSSGELRLWDEAVDALGWGGKVIAADPWRPNKLRCAAPQTVEDHRQLPVSAILSLEFSSDPDPSITRLSGAEAVKTILSETAYRPKLAQLLDRESSDGALAMHAASNIPIFKLRRGPGLDKSSQITRMIKEAIRNASK